jgi:hypothetical protein
MDSCLEEKLTMALAGDKNLSPTHRTSFTLGFPIASPYFLETSASVRQKDAISTMARGYFI